MIVEVQVMQNMYFDFICGFIIHILKEISKVKEMPLPLFS